MTNDVFIGFLHAGNLQKEDIELASKIFKNGKTVELGCHPGFESPELKEIYKHWGIYNWQKELGLFSSK